MNSYTKRMLDLIKIRRRCGLRHFSDRFYRGFYFDFFDNIFARGKFKISSQSSLLKLLSSCDLLALADSKFRDFVNYEGDLKFRLFNNSSNPRSLDKKKGELEYYFLIYTDNLFRGQIFYENFESKLDDYNLHDFILFEKKEIDWSSLNL